MPFFAILYQFLPPGMAKKYFMLAFNQPCTQHMQKGWKIDSIKIFKWAGPSEDFGNFHFWWLHRVQRQKMHIMRWYACWFRRTVYKPDHPIASGMLLLSGTCCWLSVFGRGRQTTKQVMKPDLEARKVLPYKSKCKEYFYTCFFPTFSWVMK